MTQSALENFGCVVITTKSTAESTTLSNSLNRAGIEKVVFLSATLEKDIVDDSPTTKKQLTRIERAISMSHHRARLYGRQQCWDWILILEEDAIIDEDMLLPVLVKFSNSIQLNTAFVLHLFPESFGFGFRRVCNDFIEMKRVPDCAVGYFMNKSSIVSSTASKSAASILHQVADWPREMKTFSWWAFDASVVKHPDIYSEDLQSSTTLARNERISHKSFFAKLRFLPLLFMMFSLIPGNRRLRYGSSPIPRETFRTIVIRGKS